MNLTNSVQNKNMELISLYGGDDEWCRWGISVEKGDLEGLEKLIIDGYVSFFYFRDWKERLKEAKEFGDERIIEEIEKLIYEAESKVKEFDFDEENKVYTRFKMFDGC